MLAISCSNEHCWPRSGVNLVFWWGVLFSSLCLLSNAGGAAVPPFVWCCIPLLLLLCDATPSPSSPFSWCCCPSLLQCGAARSLPSWGGVVFQPLPCAWCCLCSPSLCGAVFHSFLGVGGCWELLRVLTFFGCGVPFSSPPLGLCCSLSLSGVVLFLENILVGSVLCQLSVLLEKKKHTGETAFRVSYFDWSCCSILHCFDLAFLPFWVMLSSFFPLLGKIKQNSALETEKQKEKKKNEVKKKQKQKKNIKVKE